MRFTFTRPFCYSVLTLLLVLSPLVSTAQDGLSVDGQPDSLASSVPAPSISQASRDRARQILEGANIAFLGGRFVKVP
jgi:hypothetical protein